MRGKPGGIKAWRTIRTATGKRPRKSAHPGDHGGTANGHTCTSIRDASRLPGRAGPGRVHRPDLHPGPARPPRVAEPAAPLGPAVAPARLVPGCRLLGYRVRRPRPGTAQPGPGLEGVHRRRAAPRRRHGRPARRSRLPRPPVRRRGVRGHRAVRPGHVQRAETGKGTVPAGNTAVCHRRARRYRRRQRHHRPGKAGQAGRGGMVPAATEREDLERAGGAFTGRVEHRCPGLRVRRRADPAPGPVQGRPGPHQIPA